MGPYGNPGQPSHRAASIGLSILGTDAWMPKTVFVFGSGRDTAVGRPNEVVNLVSELPAPARRSRIVRCPSELSELSKLVRSVSIASAMIRLGSKVGRSRGPQAQVAANW